MADQQNSRANIEESGRALSLDSQASVLQEEELSNAVLKNIVGGNGGEALIGHEELSDVVLESVVGRKLWSGVDKP